MMEALGTIETVGLAAAFEAADVACKTANVELIGYEEDNAYVKLGGGCQGCSSSMATLKMGIERRLKEEVPELKEVIDQTDHASGASPYFL